MTLAGSLTLADPEFTIIDPNPWIWSSPWPGRLFLATATAPLNSTTLLHSDLFLKLHAMVLIRLHFHAKVGETSTHAMLMTGACVPSPCGVCAPSPCDVSAPPHAASVLPPHAASVLPPQAASVLPPHAASVLPPHAASVLPPQATLVHPPRNFLQVGLFPDVCRVLQDERLQLH